MISLTKIGVNYSPQSTLHHLCLHGHIPCCGGAGQKSSVFPTAQRSSCWWFGSAALLSGPPLVVAELKFPWILPGRVLWFTFRWKGSVQLDFEVLVFRRFMHHVDFKTFCEMLAAAIFIMPGMLTPLFFCFCLCLPFSHSAKLLLANLASWTVTNDKRLKFTS